MTHNENNPQQHPSKYTSLYIYFLHKKNNNPELCNHVTNLIPIIMQFKFRTKLHLIKHN